MREHRVGSSDIFSQGRVGGRGEKKIGKMLTPGIEPGLPKPQSGVLPLYYVSFLMRRCIGATSFDEGASGCVSTRCSIFGAQKWCHPPLPTFDGWCPISGRARRPVPGVFSPCGSLIAPTWVMSRGRKTDRRARWGHRGF